MGKFVQLGPYHRIEVSLLGWPQWCPGVSGCFTSTDSHSFFVPARSQGKALICEKAAKPHAHTVLQIVGWFRIRTSVYLPIFPCRVYCIASLSVHGVGLGYQITKPLTTKTFTPRFVFGIARETKTAFQ